MLGCFVHPQQVDAIWPDCISQLFYMPFVCVCVCVCVCVRVSADALMMEAAEEPNMIK